MAMNPLGTLRHQRSSGAGKTARATGSVIAARLILMGVWHDSLQP
jgi:hypothetical protein